QVSIAGLGTRRRRVVDHNKAPGAGRLRGPPLRPSIPLDCAAKLVTIQSLSVTRSIRQDGLRFRPFHRFCTNSSSQDQMQTIDVHAHILTEETIRLMRREAPTIGPRLSDMGERFASLDVAGNVYRHFPRGGWDLEQRLQDMAAAKVDIQVLSVSPQTFLYGQPAPLAAALARIQNEQLAKLAKARPDRFLA